MPEIQDFPGGVLVAPAQDGEAWLPPAWWQPHPVLFSAFAAWDAERSVFCIGEVEAGALQIAERIGASERWHGGPVLLVTQSAPAGWAVQLLSDYLQVPVVAGAFEAQWWVTSPRCTERGWMPPAPLPGAFPFESDSIAKFRTTMPAAPTPAATVPAQDLRADERSAALLEPGRRTPLEEELHDWLGSQWKPGLYAVAVSRTPDSLLTPYAFGGSAWTGWDLAAELWAIRDRWQPHARVLCLLTDGLDAVDELQLRLLSRYLGIEVVDARGPVLDAGPAPQEREQGAALHGPARSEDPDSAATETASSALPPPTQIPSAIGVPAALLGMVTTVAADPSAARSLPVSPVGEAGENGDFRQHLPHHAEPAAGLDNALEPPNADTAITVTAAAAARAATAAPGNTQTTAVASAEAAAGVGPATAPSGAQEWQSGVLRVPESVDAGHSSTVQERAMFRELMHRRYDVHARAVTQTLATSPGLRSGSGGPASAGEFDVCDLAAVRALVNGDWPQEPRPAQLAAWAACLTSGLRMLPTFRGPAYVWRGWEDIDPDLLTVGQIVTCDNVLRARLAPSGDVQQSPMEAVVWSQSGRRTRLLLPEDAQDEVLFPGRTAFRVLAVQAGESRPVARVLLRQLSFQEFARARTLAAAGQDGLGDKDVKARVRLLAEIGGAVDEAVPHIATV